jgi:hypothetical protein
VLFEGRQVAEGEAHEAPVPRRVGAWAVDALIAGFLSAAALRGLLILTSPKQAYVHLSDVRFLWVPPVCVTVWVIYRALSEHGGGSVGKRLFGVHVQTESGKRLGFAQAAARALTAPFDAVLGHLENEGPFDKRRKAKVVTQTHLSWTRLAAPAFWIALATACAIWLIATPTQSLAKELRWLQTQNQCGQIPRQVIHFTDRGTGKATVRCDRVMRELLERARNGDGLATRVVTSLPHASDWGELPSARGQ